MEGGMSTLLSYGGVDYDGKQDYTTRNIVVGVIVLYLLYVYVFLPSQDDDSGDDSYDDSDDDSDDDSYDEPSIVEGAGRRSRRSRGGRTKPTKKVRKQLEMKDFLPFGRNGRRNNIDTRVQNINTRNYNRTNRQDYRRKKKIYNSKSTSKQKTRFDNRNTRISTRQEAKIRRFNAKNLKRAKNTDNIHTPYILAKDFDLDKDGMAYDQYGI
jgi:hypothetical protein